MDERSRTLMYLYDGSSDVTRDRPLARFSKFWNLVEKQLYDITIVSRSDPEDSRSFLEIDSDAVFREFQRFTGEQDHNNYKFCLKQSRSQEPTQASSQRREGDPK